MIDSAAVAADEIADLFRLAWSPRPVAWPNVAFDKPALSATWARWGLEFADGGQRTLAGAGARPRFGKSGIVTIEILTPLGAGLKVAYEAADVAVKAYEGKRTPGDVWFRNVRIAEEGEGASSSTGWWSTVVVAEFTYDNL